MTTLADIPVGIKCKILKISSHGALNRRIRDMGIMPGAEIEVKNEAPLGDPISITINNFCLSLRKNEARTIYVEQVQ